MVKRKLPQRPLLAGLVLALAGCATTGDRYELPGLERPSPRGAAGAGPAPFAWYYGPGDVPRLNSGPLPFYDPYSYYRHGGLPPRYYGPFPYGYGPGYGPGFGLAYGPGYGDGYPFGPSWPDATATCRDANRNGRCDAYEPRPPKPSKQPRPRDPGDAGPPPPRAAPPKPADRGDERERPRRRLPQVEPETDR